MLICVAEDCNKLAATGSYPYYCREHYVEFQKKPNGTVVADRETLVLFAKTEQMYLWDDFAQSLRRCSDGVWSIGTEQYLWRLIRAVLVVGPIDYDSVPWILLGSDIWSTILDLARVPHAAFTEEQWGFFEQRLHTFGGSRAELMAKYEPTRETLKGLSFWETLNRGA